MDVSDLYRRTKFCTKLFKRCGINLETAERELVTFYRKDKPCFSQQNDLVPQYDLMIVLPVYNVEAYLEQCLESLFSQKTSYSYGIVAVDDGSTDSSREILLRYQERDNLKIILQENKGLSGARNRALKDISGKYTMFVDSDDLLPDGAVDVMLKTAFQYHADVVAGGYEEFSEKGILSRSILTSEPQRVTAGQIPGYACMKVFRSELLKDFAFPEGFLFEDTAIHRILLPQCERIIAIPDVVYRYRMHEKSLTHSCGDRGIETFWITKYCLEEAKRRELRFGQEEYVQLLQQCWVNYIRTRYMQHNIQECLFILTCEMLEAYWPSVRIRSMNKYRLLHEAMRRRSYAAYRYVLQRWECM